MKEKKDTKWFIISIITFLMLFIMIAYAYFSKTLQLEAKIIVIIISGIGIVYAIKDYYFIIKERIREEKKR